jgi:hypothetical protein
LTTLAMVRPVRRSASRFRVGIRATRSMSRLCVNPSCQLARESRCVSKTVRLQLLQPASGRSSTMKKGKDDLGSTDVKQRVPCRRRRSHSSCFRARRNRKNLRRSTQSGALANHGDEGELKYRRSQGSSSLCRSMSLGTFATCRLPPRMSVDRGRPEVIDRLSKRRFW